MRRTTAIIEYGQPANNGHKQSKISAIWKKPKVLVKEEILLTVQADSSEPISP